VKLINKDHSFLAKRNNNSISQYQACLKKYAENLEQEITLTSKTPIFLDTNILLRFYSISFAARKKLFEFIHENSKRIFITTQVQTEFIKNREDVIQRFFEQVTNKIPKDFNSDIVNKINSFLEQHKVVLKDYPFVENGIKEHQGKLEQLLEKLNRTIEDKRKEQENLITNDQFLDLLNNCQAYEDLTSDEQEFIKKEFDALAKGVSSDSIDSILNKVNAIFPGLGDIKFKPDDPYGDYIIYHEIMKFMLNKKSDVVYLTFDNSKGDWMSKNKSPYLHYVQNMYLNTGYILYILDAERALGELLNIDINSLVKSNSISETSRPFTIESLSKFLNDSTIFAGIHRGVVSKTLIDELNTNGYNDMAEIEGDSNKGADALKAYRITAPRHPIRKSGLQPRVFIATP
jgi:hypothetical protein